MRLSTAIAISLLIALAGCASDKSSPSVAPLWQLGSKMDGTTKLCWLARSDSSRSLTLVHKRIPGVPELGVVYFRFRAPELITAPNMQWAVTLQYDSDWRTGFISAVDENVVYVVQNTMMLKDIFTPMETATILDVKVLVSGAIVHFDLTGLSGALPALHACAADGIAL